MSLKNRLQPTKKNIDKIVIDIVNISSKVRPFFDIVTTNLTKGGIINESRKAHNQTTTIIRTKKED